jgi:hypothetical protein
MYRNGNRRTEMPDPELVPMTHGPHHLPVVDAHVHIHPAYAEHVADAMEANYLQGIVCAGILESLGLPFEESMRAYRRTFGQRLVYFPAPDFSDTSPGFGEHMAQKLTRKVDAGARGLKIYKEFGLRHKDTEGNLIPVDDPRLDPLWAQAGKLGVPVLMHTADPVSFFQPLDEDNESWEELRRHPDWWFGGPDFPDHSTLLDQFLRLLERHPDTTFIAAHIGHYAEDLAYVDDCLTRYPNLYVDTAARIPELGRQPIASVRAFFIKNQDRILFGSDLTVGWSEFEAVDPEPRALQRFYDKHWRFFETHDRQFEHPFYPIEGSWKVDAIGLPLEVLEKLYYRNARSLIAV